MKAVTVIPGTAGSLRLDVPEPTPRLGSVVVQGLAVVICGTDAEIASGSYGWVPPERQRLILGHESLGRVVDPAGRVFAIRGLGMTGQPCLPYRGRFERELSP